MTNFFAELKRRRMLRGAARYAAVAWVLLQLVNNVTPALAAESPRRIFLLQGSNANQSSVQQMVEAFEQRLRQRSAEDVEVYSDNLDLRRFSGLEAENRLSEFLRGKLAQAKPGVIVLINRPVVGFMIRHRAELARDIPMVYCCTSTSMTAPLDVPPDIPGLVVELDWAGTLALAQRFQPNAKTFVQISGASDTDRRRDQDAARALKPLLREYEIKYLTGLPYKQLVEQVSRLPRDSIVFLTRVFEDGSGRARGAEVAADLSKASTAPIYSPLATYFGSGIVGGRMDSYAGQGVKVADLALDILSGKDPATLPHQSTFPSQYRVDARQLERWGFAEASLPPGTSVEFGRPTLWEAYRNTIIFVLVAFAMLVGIIALLLFEIYKRRVAEEARKIAVSEAELGRSELKHMMRVAALGELSGGIAHELSQPLTAILFNAQAAQELVDKNGDREAIAEILEDIVQDDRRAGEVIQHLRQLMKKGEPETTLINLNDKIASTLGLLHSELVNRRIKVQTDLRTDVPPVSGDRVQLQQVFLNLMMNAMDAMASTPPSDRILCIATRTTEECYVEVSIRDGGPGMSAETLKRVFEPFFTTKERGLGLGLSICSTILTSHRGRLNLSNAIGGGITAVVSLPLARQLAVAS
jgi:signal transduction histidine kinase